MSDEQWPSALEAAEYELYVLRLWADSQVNDVSDGGLFGRVRRHLKTFGLEPHVIKSDLSEFDRRAGKPQEQKPWFGDPFVLDGDEWAAAAKRGHAISDEVLADVVKRAEHPIHDLGIDPHTAATIRLNTLRRLAVLLADEAERGRCE